MWLCLLYFCRIAEQYVNIRTAITSAACTQRANPPPTWVSLQLLTAPPRSLVQAGRGRLVDAPSRESTERREMKLLSISVYLPHDCHLTCVISLKRENLISVTGIDNVDFLMEIAGLVFFVPLLPCLPSSSPLRARFSHLQRLPALPFPFLLSRSAFSIKSDQLSQDTT